MNLLFCCEFYHPSVGGVQEVMRQIAERMVERGHAVTVATTKLPQRSCTTHNGVKIEEFAIHGNSVGGLRGEVERYRRFVATFAADAVLIKAAQQWTFDALWPIIPSLRARKVFIPCGFPALNDPAYGEYYTKMPDVLKWFDHLIFYSSKYRDIDFARQNGISSFSIIPNGASEHEFSASRKDGALRAQLGIADDAFLFLTVGSLTGTKGHGELAEAFSMIDTGGRSAALVLNGNKPFGLGENATGRRLALLKEGGELLRKAVRVAVSEGAGGLHRRLVRHLADARRRDLGAQIRFWSKVVERQEMKKMVVTDLGRDELLELYGCADLFVFASNIEYSPLVLFESVAAGTPFLAVPVGNSEEIAQWTEGGMICPATIDHIGFTRANPRVLARAMELAMQDTARLERMGEAGRRRWQSNFTWQRIAQAYEAVLAGRKSGNYWAQGLS